MQGTGSFEVLYTDLKPSRENSTKNMQHILFIRKNGTVTE